MLGVAALVLACSSVTPEEPGSALPRKRFVGARGLDGKALSFTAVGGHVVEEGAGEVVDLAGHFVVPAFIDSHVHLAYAPRAAELLAGGIAGAVDLAAPLRYLDAPDRTGPELLLAGPMLTAPQGYPTQTWGSDGFGWELASAEEAEAAVEELAKRGAVVVKLALAGDPELDDEALSRAVARAHALGLKTAAHATSALDAERAALAGVDVLAHTPTELLPESVLAQWGQRAVISTLGVFGGSAALQNLRELRQRGARVLYGTDFGNSQFAGIQPAELEGLRDAGLDAVAIVAAGTSDPSSYWGLPELGGLRVGQRASFLELDADPREDLLTLSRPLSVYIDGERRGPAPP